MPFRFFRPAKKPRTVCGAQFMASAICATVAPSGRRSIASTCDCLVPRAVALTNQWRVLVLAWSARCEGCRSDHGGLPAMAFRLRTRHRRRAGWPRRHRGASHARWPAVAPQGRQERPRGRSHCLAALAPSWPPRCPVRPRRRPSPRCRQVLSRRRVCRQFPRRHRQPRPLPQDPRGPIAPVMAFRMGDS